MRSNCILVIVMMILIGCDKAEGGGTTTPNVINRTITPEDNKPEDTQIAFEDYTPTNDIVEIYLDDMPFSEAFRIERLTKGKNQTFWWNNNEYTTDFYTETASGGQYNWVRNSNDLDDYCSSNKWDACGICNGPGPLLWYRDQDGDGLGDPEWSVENCFYPSVDEE